MRSDQRMTTAAYVAGTFRLDPVDVLDSDYFDWMIRIVCADIYWEQRRKAEEKANK